MTQQLSRQQASALKVALNEMYPDQLEELYDVQPGKRQIYLQQAFDEFLSACKARQLSKHTIEDYTRTITMFIKHIGDMEMNRVSTSQIAAFLGSLTGVKAKTVLNRHIGLAAFWTWAMRQEYVDRHIVKLVSKPRPQLIVIDPFSEEEVRALLSVHTRNAERDRALIYLLLDTGLRASELIDLNLDDIDLEKRRLIVLNGKGNKERILPFSKTTKWVLSIYLEGVTGKPFNMNRTSLATLIGRMGEKAGVKDAHPHKFRHTFAINYLKNGGDVFSLQEMLGHSTLDMVRHYVKLATVDVEKAHERASPVENWSLLPMEAWIRREPVQTKAFKPTAMAPSLHNITDIINP